MTETEKLQLYRALRDPQKLELMEKLAELEGISSQPIPTDTADRIATEVKALFGSFEKKHQFEKGMLVEWKPKLKNRKRPRYGEPGIVVEVLSQPVLGATDESGSAYFREPLDLLVGFLDTDGEFIVFHYDGRRFQPYSRK